MVEPLRESMKHCLQYGTQRRGATAGRWRRRPGMTAWEREPRAGLKLILASTETRITRAIIGKRRTECLAREDY
jgi:hypothetical protein